ncbi:hypothetical protein AN958_09775 [Leucoagaricus sp. SymC.cos]|nr:hypothetical protein AN958_09775 [Leucoagaricus sp. SymC.cos]
MDSPFASFRVATASSTKSHYSDTTSLSSLPLPTPLAVDMFQYTHNTFTPAPKAKGSIARRKPATPHLDKENIVPNSHIPETPARTASKRPATTNLHETETKRRAYGSRKLIERKITSATVTKVAKILQQHQPITWRYLVEIASNRTSTTTPQRRPPDLVVTHALSSLNFCRNQEARLLPFSRGLLYFAHSAPVDLMAYGSHTAEMPAYTTIYNSLKSLSDHEATLLYKVMQAFRENSKLPLTVKPTKVHPLATSSKNETVTTELKDGLVNFLLQLGQKDGDYHECILLASGDGLTFQKMLELTRYLQFHNDAFQSFEVLEPTLSTWHTEWTALSCLYETHWNNILSPDPSSIGHNAAKIKHPAPSNLKKVDYSNGTSLLHLILDVRILDCWRLFFGCKNLREYFSALATSGGSLPGYDELFSTAKKLHYAYSSSYGIYHALDDVTRVTPWSSVVPVGSKWAGKPLSTPTKVSSGSTPRHELGDRVLANSITLICDGLMLKEICYAVAEGSSHSKYSTYLLESITCLELESSPALREAILKSTLVNLSGQAGSFTAADIMQEYFNRLLEAIIEKKGVEYDAHFIRSVISRNLYHFARIKLDLRIGVGLEAHSSKHASPHMNPEVQVLLKVYQATELHCRRPGRVFKDIDKDNFQRGLFKLQGGQLQKWVVESTTTRRLRHLVAVSLNTQQDLEELEPESSDKDEDDDLEEVRDDNQESSSFSLPYVIGGRLILIPIEISSEIDELIEVVKQ